MVGGALYALTAFFNLPLGTLRAMGPGLFPVGLGSLLVLIGLGILIPALLVGESKLPTVKPRALIAVLAAVAAFALLIGPFGLLPAIVASTVVSSLAVPGNRPLRVLLLAIFLMFVAWLIFILLLQLPVSMVSWGV